MIKEKKLKIDFLYLDLSECKRCRATDQVLDKALDELREGLRDLKELRVNKIEIKSDREAKKYDFVRSPTIRINGIDIEEILTGKLRIKDNYCKSCAAVRGNSYSEITGGGTCRCRIFRYNGKMYNSPPKEMIKDAIRRVLKIKK